MHNALVGTGLRDRVRIGASGGVATGSDIVKRLAQGADYTNAARAMMFALGCLQSRRCHTNTCPVGVATQDPRRVRALDVADKSARVHRYQRATVRSASRIMAAMGYAIRPSSDRISCCGVRTRRPYGRTRSSTRGWSPGAARGAARVLGGGLEGGGSGRVLSVQNSTGSLMMGQVMQWPPPRPRPSSAPTMVMTSIPALRSRVLVWVLRS